MVDKIPPADEPSDPPPGDLVDAVYEVALDPSRYSELVDRWYKELKLAADQPPLETINEPLAEHFERASTILERVHKDDWKAETSAPPAMPEFSLSPGGRVLETNPGAVALLSARVGTTLEALDFTPAAQSLVAAVMAQLIDQAKGPKNNRPAEARVLRLNRADDDRPLVILLTPAGQGSDAAVLLRCAEIIWPDSLGPLLARAFDLTSAETQIVQALVAGEISATIATSRGTSRETVRTQIRELLAKTGTHSQLELIRMTIGFSMMAQQAEARSSGDAQSTYDAKTKANTVASNDTHTTPQSDLIRVAPNRQMELLQYGDTNQPPTLVFHDEVIGDGFLLPLLKCDPDLHFVVVSRYGYGNSDLLDDAELETRISQTIKDLSTAIDNCTATRDATSMPILAHGNGIYFACRYAQTKPQRCSSITALSPSLPRTSADQSDTTRYATFISNMASIAPSMLRFAVQAGFAMYARVGTKRFLQTVYGSVPADLAVINTPEHLQDLEHGGRLTLAQGYRGFLHDEEAMTLDWTPLITGLSLPIRLIIGAAESTGRKERAERLQRMSAANGSHCVQIVTGANGRFFLAFIAPELVLATLKDAHDESQRTAASA